MIRTAHIFSVVAVAISAGAQAQSCDLPLRTALKVEAMLCGTDRDPAAYRFEGERCVEASLTRRFEDTAAQIAMLDACGHPDLAAELREATEAMAAGVLSSLAACSRQSVDPVALFARAVETVRKRPNDDLCTAANRRLIGERLPTFRRLVVEARDPAQSKAIYDALEIQVDEAGNVAEQ